MEITQDIVIVGGGIAGLTTSLGLHRSLLYKHINFAHICIRFYPKNLFIRFANIYVCSCCRLGIKSVVLESSDSLRITGFAFMVWTNAWKALEALGIDDSIRQQHKQLHGYTQTTISFILPSAFITIHNQIYYRSYLRVSVLCNRHILSVGYWLPP